MEVITDPDAFAAFLGVIDTGEEAAAAALAAGFSVQCGAVADGGVRAAADGFEVIASEYTSTCSPIVQNRLQLGVTADGTVSVLDTQEIERNLFVCIGRRPEGLEPTPTNDRATLGEVPEPLLRAAGMPPIEVQRRLVEGLIAQIAA